jgi:hypothetical protein
MSRLSVSSVEIPPLPDARRRVSARAAHAFLRQALGAEDRAHHCAVLWFGEIHRRALYRDLGFSSIHPYAAQALAFSPNRTYRFLHLAARLEELPRLKAAVAAGRIGWTVAREVVKVASAANEERWLAEARTGGRRALERKVRMARRRKAARKGEQAEIGVPAAAGAGGEPARAVTAWASAGEAAERGAGAAARADGPGGATGAARSRPADSEAAASAPSLDFGGGADLSDDAPATVSFRLDALQQARYEAVIEALRKTRALPAGLSRAEIMLQALETMHAAVVAGSAGGNGRGPGGARSRGGAPGGNGGSEGRPAGSLCPGARAARSYKIVLYKCDRCHAVHAQTSGGLKAVTPAQAAAAGCDAVIERPDGTHRATIPPRVRREVLARARGCCQAPGCRRTQFLEVHHLKPRSRGGTHALANLVVLCSRCHQLWHERGWGAEALKRPARE